MEMNVVDIAGLIDELADDPRSIIVFRLLPKELAAEVFAYLERDQQQRIVEVITDKELAGIVDELFLDDTVDFLDEMPASIVKRVIKTADPATRKSINQLLMYPDDSAGSLMTIEFMELDSDWNVARAIAEIRKKSADKESIAMLFVTDRQRHLEGVVELQDVLSADDETFIRDLMETDVISVRTHDDQADVAELFKKYDLLSLPVVDTENRLVGLITIDDVVDVMEEETTEDIYKMAAMAPVVGTYRNAGVFTLARKRVVWLLALMLLTTVTALIIENYEAALSSNVILASFFPSLMDTGGNAGSQTSTSVIRGLVLGEISFHDMLFVLWKEFRVSLLVGLAVAAVNCVRVVIMHGDWMLGLTVSLTMFCAIVAAKLVGCILPLVATKIKLDPALMASPMITTIVDAVTLIMFFNIAMWLMPMA